MARKKKHPEHVNLERWLVSYADFMTLLFATFVVLYALAQSSAEDFKSLEETLKKAFQGSLFDGNTSLLSGSNSLLSGSDGSTSPIMLEYISPKYEENAYGEIKNEIDKLNDKNIKAVIDERGLVIKLFNDSLTFNSGSADINLNSYVVLDKIAKMIHEKFKIHIIRVEGHTDSIPTNSPIYQSNWELSTGRASSIVRYLIERHGFSPNLFIAAGYADTVPVAKGNTEEDRAKNRRVELVILKNSLKKTSSKNLDTLNEISKENSRVKTKQESVMKENTNTVELEGETLEINQETSASEAQKKKIEDMLNNADKTGEVYENELNRIDQFDNAVIKEKPYFLD